jgi:purine catabolism regulator
MLSESLVCTVADVCRHALPLNTTIVAGSSSTSRPVRWVASGQIGGPLPYLEGDEFVILTPGGHPDDLAEFVTSCAAMGAAALACLPPIAPLALARADLANLPLLQLPADSKAREVERSVISFLFDRQGHSERLGLQIYQQLIQLASENVGLKGIITTLAKYLNKGIIVQDKNLRIKVEVTSPRLAESWEGILETVQDRRALPESLRDRHNLPRGAVAGLIQTYPKSDQQAREDFSRLIAPIINHRIGRGYLSFIAAGDESFDDVDMQVVSHAAVVCALEMARAKAISDAEKKLRGDFLTSLMVGTVSEAEAQAEGDRTGHDMNAPHIAIVMTWYGNRHPSGRRLETLVNGLLGKESANNVLTQLRDNELRLFYAPETSDSVAAARQLCEEVRRQAEREYKEVPLAAGIGSVAGRVWEWRSSYRDAAQAADIARRLKSDVALYSGDLGVYTLLARSDFRDDLRTLRDKMIGNLLKYEERQRADLLQTLEAFFQCHGNHTQTAELLSVHRNTLFYRMNRIAEITKLDLNQPDVRLALHLSLKIHRLLGDDA